MESSVQQEIAAPKMLPKSMRAWAITAAGPPGKILKPLVDAPVPSLGSETSILVRVSHVALHPGSLILMHLVPMVCRGTPSVAETDFSGTVVATGSKVPTSLGSAQGDRCFPIGAAVFGSVPVPVHLRGGAGTLAEYVAVEMDSVVLKPDAIPFDRAAGLGVSAITAMDVVDLAAPRAGHKVLVNAPCGGVGSFATQLVRHAVGAQGTVVGICSPSRSSLAKKLGCDETLDYKATHDGQDLITVLKSRFSGEDAFDAVVDCHGSQELWHSASSFLKAGREHPYATVGPKFGSLSYGGMLAIACKMMMNSLTPIWAGGTDRSYKQAASFINLPKLDRIKSLASEGVIATEVGGLWKFDDALEAYNMMMDGHATGKLIVKI